METETLHCDIGDHKFEREVKRGRKPKSCPECKAGKKAKPKAKKKVNKKVLKDAQKKYKQRTQMLGDYFKPLGEPKYITTTSGFVLETYDSFELTDGTVERDTLVREKGMSGRYRFLSLVVREDGTAYANLLGASGVYSGKYRSIGVDKLTL